VPYPQKNRPPSHYERKRHPHYDVDDTTIISLSLLFLFVLVLNIFTSSSLRFLRIRDLRVLDPSLSLFAVSFSLTSTPKIRSISSTALLSLSRNRSSTLHP
jgi:hypothetical protein